VCSGFGDVSDADMHYVFRALDDDDSGTLSIEEWLRYLKDGRANAAHTEVTTDELRARKLLEKRFGSNFEDRLARCAVQESPTMSLQGSMSRPSRPSTKKRRTGLSRSRDSFAHRPSVVTGSAAGPVAARVVGDSEKAALSTPRRKTVGMV